MEVFVHKKRGVYASNNHKTALKQPSNFPYITPHKPTFTPVSHLE